MCSVEDKYTNGNITQDEYVTSLGLYPKKIKKPEGFKHDKYIYFIDDGDFVKIGVTDNIVQRIHDFYCGNCREFNLDYVITCSDPELCESLLHKHYSEYKIRGEWFDIYNSYDINDAIEYIKDFEPKLIDEKIFEYKRCV